MRRLLAGLFMILLSVGMIAVALNRSVPVYDEDVAEDDFAIYDDISEIDLTRDATFGGVIRSASTGRLITTYDRSQPVGRRACPT